RATRAAFATRNGLPRSIHDRFAGRGADTELREISSQEVFASRSLPNRPAHAVHSEDLQRYRNGAKAARSMPSASAELWQIESNQGFRTRFLAGAGETKPVE